MINKNIALSNENILLKADIKDEKIRSTSFSNIGEVEKEKVSFYQTKNSWSFFKGLFIALAFIAGVLSSK